MDDGDDVSEQPEEVGSVAEEATKLFAAFSEWAQHQRADTGEGEGTHASTCTWCPLCRAVDLVRQTSPEVRAQVAEAASNLLQVAAGWLASVGASAAESDDEPAAAEPPASPSQQTPKRPKAAKPQQPGEASS